MLKLPSEMSAYIAEVGAPVVSGAEALVSLAWVAGGSSFMRPVVAVMRSEGA